MTITVGLDEAGRGPLAGPVIAAAVILDPNKPISGLKDSKQLSAKKREYLHDVIVENCLSYAVGRADIEEIDSINILQASLLAMQRAFEALTLKPTHALVDGAQCPQLSCKTEAIVGGDNSIPAISAASIIAKVVRDKEMLELDEQFPHYGFAKHKGYGTKLHLEMLRLHGVSICHRKSFAPVKELIKVD